MKLEFKLQHKYDNMKPTINLCSYILFIFVEFHVAQSLVFCVVFYESTFVFLSFLVRTMYCLSFWQLRFLMTSLTFSMTSIDLFWFWFFAGHVYNMIPISCREFRIWIPFQNKVLVTVPWAQPPELLSGPPGGE